MRIALYFFTVIFARHLNALVFGSLLLCTFGIPKLCANSIQWSSYVGSADTDSAEAVAVGADGSVYVVYSSGDEVSDVDFHWGTGITYVIAKFTSDGSQIEWKTGIGLDYTNPPTDDKGELVAGHPNQFGYGSIAGLSVDPDGNVVLAATIGGDSEWPVENAEQSTYGGGDVDGVVLKLSSDGDELLFSTFLGGDSFDRIRNVQVADDGRIFLTGATRSQNFPGIQTPAETWAETVVPGFVSILNAEGVLQSTMMVGTEYPNSVTECRSLAFGSNGTLWIGGSTSAKDLLVSGDAFQSEHAGILDGFMMQISINTSEIIFSSFFGGESEDVIESIASDGQGLLAFGGTTFSRNLPLVQPFQDTLLEIQSESRVGIFVGVLDTNSKQLITSSYLSGSLEESLAGVAIDAKTGDVWMAGATNSNDIPVLNALQSQNHAYKGSTVLCRLNSEGNLLLSTYLGGAAGNGAIDLAAVPGGGVLLAGVTGLNRNTGGFPSTLGVAMPTFFDGGSDGYLMYLHSDAQTVSNDSFANRSTVEALPMTLWANNSSASAEALESPHAEGNSGPFHSLWWSWEAPSDGFFDLATSARYRGEWNSLFSSTFDSVISVYQGDALPGLQKLAENDEDPDGLRSSYLRLPVTGGETYHFAVDGATDDAFGQFPLTMHFTREVANDHFENRIDLTEDSPSWEGDNQHASGENEEIPLDQSFHGKSVWYEWQSNYSGLMRLVVDGVDFSPHILVFEVADSISQLIPVVYYQHEDANAGEVFVNFQTNVGQSYAISIDGAGGAGGAGGAFVASLTEQTMLPNDSFLFADPVETFPYHSEPIDNEMASLEPGEPNLRASGMENLPAGLSLWWRFESAIDASLLWYCEADSLQQVFIGLYQGNDLNSLEPAASMRRVNDQRVAFEAKAGIQYYLMVDQSGYRLPGPLSVSLIEFQPPSFGSQIEINPELQTLRLSIKGVAGVQYRLEGSSDLKQWDLLNEFLMDSEEQSIDQSFDPLMPALFFRLVEVLD